MRLQRLQRVFLKSIVATSVVLTPAAATWADVPVPSAWQILAYAIVNNSTTPVPEGVSNVNEGDLYVSCFSSIMEIYRVPKDETYDLSCQVPVGATHSMTYSIRTGPETFHPATVAFDCEATETMTLTFTGSGPDITYSPSCATVDTTDDDATDDD